MLAAQSKDQSESNENVAEPERSKVDPSCERPEEKAPSGDLRAWLAGSRLRAAVDDAKFGAIERDDAAGLHGRSRSPRIGVGHTRVRSFAGGVVARC
jgi:hypothetical protein